MLMDFARNAKKDTMPTSTTNVINALSINLISMVQTATYALRPIVFMKTTAIPAPKVNILSAKNALMKAKKFTKMVPGNHVPRRTLRTAVLLNSLTTTTNLAINAKNLSLITIKAAMSALKVDIKLAMPAR